VKIAAKKRGIETLFKGEGFKVALWRGAGGRGAFGAEAINPQRGPQGGLDMKRVRLLLLFLNRSRKSDELVTTQTRTV